MLVYWSGLLVAGAVCATGQVELDGLAGGKGQWQVEGGLRGQPQAVAQLLAVVLQVARPAVHHKVEINQVVPAP